MNNEPRTVKGNTHRPLEWLARLLSSILLRVFGLVLRLGYAFFDISITIGLALRIVPNDTVNSLPNLLRERCRVHVFQLKRGLIKHLPILFLALILAFTYSGLSLFVERITKDLGLRTEGGKVNE